MIPALGKIIPSLRLIILRVRLIIPRPRLIIPTLRQIIPRAGKIIPATRLMFPALRLIIPTPGKIIPALRQMIRTPGKIILRPGRVTGSASASPPAPPPCRVLLLSVMQCRSTREARQITRRRPSPEQRLRQAARWRGSPALVAPIGAGRVELPRYAGLSSTSPGSAKSSFSRCVRHASRWARTASSSTRVTDRFRVSRRAARRDRRLGGSRLTLFPDTGRGWSGAAGSRTSRRSSCGWPGSWPRRGCRRRGR